MSTRRVTPPPTSRAVRPSRGPATGPATDEAAATAACAEHAEVPAEWRCRGCRKPWCDDCVVVRGDPVVARRLELVLCPECRERCSATEQRAVQRVEQERERAARLSVGWVLGDAVTRPLGRFGMLAVGLLGLYCWATRRMGMEDARLVVVPYYLTVLRHAALGEPEVPGSAGWSDPWHQVLRPTGAWALAVAVPLAPAVVYGVLVHASAREALADPVVLLLALVAAAVLPSVATVATLTGSVVAALDPRGLVARVRAYGALYALLVLVVAGMMMLEAHGAALPPPWRGVRDWVVAYGMVAGMAALGNAAHRSRDVLPTGLAAAPGPDTRARERA